MADSLVRADLSARSVTPAILPFGQTFVIRGKVEEKTGAVFLRLSPRIALLDEARVRDSTVGRFVGAVCSGWVRAARSPRARTKETEFELDVATPLRPRTTYDVELLLVERADSTTIIVPDEPPQPDAVAAGVPTPELPRASRAREDSARCDPRVVLRQRGIDAGDPGAVLIITDSINIVAASAGTFEDHFKFDLGYAHGFLADYTAVATTVHLYSSPVSRRTDLLVSGLSRWDELRSRVSLALGLAAFRFDRTPGVQPRTTIGAPIVGLGIRSPLYGWCPIPRKTKDDFCLQWLRPVLQPLRLNVGALVLEQEHPNPLIDEHRTVFDPFVSVAYDIEIRALLGPFVGFFGGK